MFGFRNFYLRIFLLKRAELRIVLLFVGPDTGFRLIVTSTLDKLLNCRHSMKHRTKRYKLQKVKRVLNCEDIMLRTKLDSAIEKFHNEELSN